MAMIVRNEERTILACLESFWDHVDEVVIVDTGSTDDTIKTIVEFASARSDVDVDMQTSDAQARFIEKHMESGVYIGKLRLHHFDWVDHFAKARQFAWDKLTTDWGVWCDGDDVVVGAENMHALAAGAPDVIGAFIFEYDYARDERGNCICRLQRERLVRLGAGARWQLPVHEVLMLPPDRMPQQSDAVTYVHNRLPDKFALDRNYLILKREYDELKADGATVSARTVGYLATELLTLGRFDESIPYFEEFLTLTTWDEEKAQALGKMTQAIVNSSNPDLERAQALAYACMQTRPDWADGYLALMDVAMHTGQFAQAVEYAKRVLEIGAPQTMLITNPLSYQLLPLLAMAQACNEIGDVKAAYLAAAQALEVIPGDPALINHYQQYRTHIKRDETVGQFLQMRELLVRHDENLKAWKLFDTVPYYAANHPAILQAKAEQYFMVAHALEDATYAEYYGDNPNETLFDVHNIEIADADKHFGRLRFLKAGLEEQATEGVALRVLDCGCNDGWMAQHLIDQCGYDVSGIDLNDRAVARALERGVEVKQGFVEDCTKLYDEGTFDAVYMFEVIEHVKDPAYTLSCLERMLKPGGRIYISTPNGAFEAGDIDNWWVVERKGHLRAMTPFEVAELCRGRGDIEGFCADPNEGLLYAAYTPEIEHMHAMGDTQVKVINTAAGKPRVDFVLGDGWQDFSPHDIATKGLGGSETAAVKMAEQFADRDYLVTVYAGKGSTQGMYGKVLYRPAGEWDATVPVDLLISSRLPEVFDRPINAKRRWLWMHDTDCGDRLTERRAAHIDTVLVLSDWQGEHLEAMYPFLSGKMLKTMNGVENERFAPRRKKRKPWVVYTSSPDRGLDVLMEVWPQVREAVPDAELHHSYAPVYFEIAAKDPHLRAFRDRVDALAASLDGVVNYGSLGAKELADLFRHAKVWAYPSWCSPHNQPFFEVSCITALEAQGAGLVCIAPNRGALAETLKTGHFMDDQPPTDEWKDTFAKQIIAALRGDLTKATPVKGQSWSDVADQWLDHLRPQDAPASLWLGAAT